MAVLFSLRRPAQKGGVLMIQFTTPAVTLTVKGVTFDGTEKVWVSIRQADKKIDIDDATVDSSGTDPVITFVLTQEQTAGLSLGAALIQVNWITTDEERGATDIVTVNVGRNLLDEVKSYDDEDQSEGDGE